MLDLFICKITSPSQKITVQTKKRCDSKVRVSVASNCDLILQIPSKMVLFEDFPLAKGNRCDRDLQFWGAQLGACCILEFGVESTRLYLIQCWYLGDAVLSRKAQ